MIQEARQKFNDKVAKIPYVGNALTTEVSPSEALAGLSAIVIGISNLACAKIGCGNDDALRTDINSSYNGPAADFAPKARSSEDYQTAYPDGTHFIGTIDGNDVIRREGPVNIEDKTSGDVSSYDGVYVRETIPGNQPQNVPGGTVNLQTGVGSGGAGGVSSYEVFWIDDKGDGSLDAIHIAQILKSGKKLPGVAYDKDDPGFTDYIKKFIQQKGLIDYENRKKTQNGQAKILGNFGK